MKLGAQPAADHHNRKTIAGRRDLRRGPPAISRVTEVPGAAAELVRMIGCSGIGCGADARRRRSNASVSLVSIAGVRLPRVEDAGSWARLRKRDAPAR
jgi:hypothetical protein